MDQAATTSLVRVMKAFVILSLPRYLSRWWGGPAVDAEQLDDYIDAILELDDDLSKHH
jgi:hypothetical protein